MITPTHVPRATYRVQLNRDFGFKKLMEIIPYLDALGISDVYLSPIFRATPDSMHGYDVTDHNQINPELGGREEFNAVSGLLRERSMGIILDFVPNHMGIQGLDNWRWLNVLESGRSSRFAPYFDIKWNPAQAHLQDRVLLPLLGGFYGSELDAGHLKLLFTDQLFFIDYLGSRFPLRPESYATILSKLAAADTIAPGVAQQLLTLAHDFGDLPKPKASESMEMAMERQAQRNALRLRLARMVEKEKLEPAIEHVLQIFNGIPGRPESFDLLHQLLEEQNYRLAFWKTGAHEINYRRFFAINTLIGLKVEHEEVFNETHRLLRHLIETQAITGVRIDHIDGLRNPRQYLDRLAQLSRSPDAPLYTVVEKILTTTEQLPLDWPVNGTTGYDFVGQVLDALINEKSADAITRIYTQFAEVQQPPKELVRTLKHTIIHELFPSVIDGLVQELEALAKSDRFWRDLTASQLRTGLTAILVCLPIYRTYRQNDGLIDPQGCRFVAQAVRDAARFDPECDPRHMQFIEEVWLGRYPRNDALEETRIAAVKWVEKLQQITGAIMAKSMEDTFFYRYVRLFANNEVGHDPEVFGKPLGLFHEANQRRLQSWPLALLGTSTHDTKTSEDVRMRILSLAEVDKEWEEEVSEWHRLNLPLKTVIKGVVAPDANEEYLLYQALIGVWPNGQTVVSDDFSKRIKAYLQKAVAEAKKHTNWERPNERWLAACDSFVEAILDPEKSSVFLGRFIPFAQDIARRGMLNSLAQVVLKLTVPGVPDIYQGNEIWDLSLVDPDNRREIDYARRTAMLTAITAAAPDPGEMLQNWEDGRIKMFIIHTVLKFRQRFTELFSRGDYEPCTVAGERAGQVIAFLRRCEGRQMVVLVPRVVGRYENEGLNTFWGDTRIVLPSINSHWREILTDRLVDQAEVLIRNILNPLPVALLFIDEA